MDWKKELEDIFYITNLQNRWRNQTINLIASENILLEEVRGLYLSDFMHRYAEGRPFERYYNGTKYIDILEDKLQEYLKKKFNVKYADVRPISGAVANLAVFSALKNNGVVITNSLTGGGHISHNKVGTLGRILKYEVFNFPLLEENKFKTDIDKTIKLIEEKNPDFVVFGKSLFLFKEPVEEIREHFPDLKIVYDAAHVFGLVYQGEFQDPFKEGADIITSSTHKTFPGPQGGLILAKNEMEDINKAIFPGILSNHHLNRIPVLFATCLLLDNSEKYKDYAKRTIKMAKHFAQVLWEDGFKVVCEKEGFTETHQVVVDVSSLGGGKKVADLLEKNGIIVNKNALPWDKSVKNPSGIRIGVQEMVLRGWKKEDFSRLGEEFKKILVKK